MKYLLPPHQKALAEFINGQLWADVKICLKDRIVPSANVKDPSHVAAAIGHKRAAAEELIEAIESLPFEHDEALDHPMARPAVAYTQD